jgi:hypothetical protein
MTPLVAQHALLIINWSDSSPPTPSTFSDSTPENEGGAALLSIPTREYLQSSSFTPPVPMSQNEYTNISVSNTNSHSHPHSHAHAGGHSPHHLRSNKVESVTSGRAFYADGHRSSVAASSLGFPENFQSMDISHSTPRRDLQSQSHAEVDDWDMYTVSHTPSIIDTRENDDGLGGDTSVPSEPQSMEERQSENSAFVGSMVYALTRKLLPGGLWSPVITSSASPGGTVRNQRSPIYILQEDRKWGLDECLK